MIACVYRRFRCLAMAIPLLVSPVLAACTSRVPLTYVADPELPTPETQTPIVSVGRFDDARGAGPDWLGAIRHNYGFPVKILRTERPMSEIVADAFADGLRARGVYAAPGAGRLELVGTIQKLDCNVYYNKEAHVILELRLLDRGGGDVPIYSGRFAADETEGGSGPAIFMSVDTLRVIAERTLRRAVNDAFSNPEFRAAIAGP